MPRSRSSSRSQSPEREHGPSGTNTPPEPVQQVQQTISVAPVYGHASQPRLSSATPHRPSRKKRGWRAVGQEPGIDPRRPTDNATYGNLKQACAIEVIDYSMGSSSCKQLSNLDLVQLLEEPNGGRPESAGVRWINIGGASWDVLSAIALKYELHPLALEDVIESLRGNASKRSKVDYYRNHLYMRVQCHSLCDEHEEDAILFQDPYDDEETEDSLGAMPDESNAEKDPEAAIPPRKRQSPLQIRARIDSRKQRVEELALAEIKKGERVHVKVQPMSIFLLRDGTVISLHPVDSLDFAQPISERLRLGETVLRTSSDPSLLIESLLDLVVDKALEVVDAYHAKIVKLEHDILVEPDVANLRYLHVISGDLILHKRTLDPIKTMIYGLRRYDLERSAAVFESDPQLKLKVVGYMSPTCKIYLADVHDHIDYILTTLDMYSTVAENLINYSFNVASYQMNQVMWRLTAVSVVCLPLTLLTGYFGMNFEIMWAIAPDKSDAIFWYFAIPILVVLIPLIMHVEIKRGLRVVKDKIFVAKLDQRTRG